MSRGAVSRSARKGQRSSASTWRRRDRAYREREAERRRVNAARRADVAEAEARGITVEQLRGERAEAES